MEEQRVQAYREYMSDSLVLIETALSRGEVDIPRYADMFKTKDDKDEDPKEETAAQIISRFDKLRRS